MTDTLEGLNEEQKKAVTTTEGYVRVIASSKAAEFAKLIESYKQAFQLYKLTDLLTGLMNDSGYEAMLRLSGEDDRLNNLAELKQSIFYYENDAGEETSLADYLQNISLLTSMDKEEKKEAVKLMTIHTAKGLEFPYVFVCGMSEMTDEQFKKYDCLLAMFEEDLSFEEAEQMIPLFSDDCDDLNWFLLHAIDSVPHAEVQNYKKLIAKCPNEVGVLQ